MGEKVPWGNNNSKSAPIGGGLFIRIQRLTCPRLKLSKIAVTRSVSTFRQPLHAPFSSTYQKVICTILLAGSLHISWHLISFICLIDTTQYFELDKMHKRNGWNFRVSDRYDKISVFHVEQEYATTSDFKFWVVHFKARLQYCTYYRDAVVCSGPSTFRPIFCMQDQSRLNYESLVSSTVCSLEQAACQQQAKVRF